MSNLDYFDGGRLVHVPTPSASPFSLDGAPTLYDIDDRPVCRYCDHVPDCAHVCDNCWSDAMTEQEAQR
jgi:hypothetical protein